MGRNAGWLTASAALASYKGNGPDLIYLPEVDFDLDAFMAKVQDIYDKNGKCIVAVSEGIKDKDGKYISEYGADLANSKDSFGHAQLGGLASFLANEIKKKTGAKVRGIELSLLQRCAAHCASKTDIEESFAAGKAAVEYAVAGIDRQDGRLRARRAKTARISATSSCSTLTVVANTEKKVPAEWLNATKDGLNEKFVEYALPLIQGETDLLQGGRAAPLRQAQEGQGVTRALDSLSPRRRVSPAARAFVWRIFGGFPLAKAGWPWYNSRIEYSVMQSLCGGYSSFPRGGAKNSGAVR